MTKPNTPRFLKVAQVAEALGVVGKTVYRWVWSGELRHHRFGASIRVAKEDLALFLATRRR